MIEVTKGQLEIQIQTITQAKEVIQGESPLGWSTLFPMVLLSARKAMGVFSYQTEGL